MLIFLFIICFVIFAIPIGYEISSNNKQRANNNSNFDEFFIKNKDVFSSCYKNKNLVPLGSYQNIYPSKTYVDVDIYGYRRFTNSDILVSHWVVEKFVIHGKLNYGEVVHHIDGNKLNNKPGNLMVFINQYEHLKHHQNNYKYGGDWHPVIPEYSDYKRFPEYSKNFN